MNKSVIVMFFISLFLWNCKNSTKKEIKVISKSKEKVVNVNPVLGSWTRSFKMSEALTATVNYTFWKDSLRYEMLGPMNMKYTIKKDTFLIDKNKWIGTKDNETYVVFIKNTTKEKVTLLKMKSKDLSTALKMSFPSDSARSKFSSWNTYNKK